MLGGAVACSRALAYSGQTLARYNEQIGGASTVAEKPIKFFPTRAETYPERDGKDIAEGLTRAGLALIPGLGGTINELISMVLAPALERRHDEWLKDLADVVDKLEKRPEGFNVKELGHNEAFVSATIQATRIAASTHQKEKRQMLRNALLNIATGKAQDDQIQQIFLGAIETFTHSHVMVLNFLWKQSGMLRTTITSYGQTIANFGQAIETALPDLQGKNDFVEHIMNDLRIRGFSSLSGRMSAYPQPAITNLGIQFLTFVAEPQA